MIFGRVVDMLLSIAWQIVGLRNGDGFLSGCLVVAMLETGYNDWKVSGEQEVSI